MSYGKIMTSLLIPKDSRSNPKRILSGFAFIAFVCFLPVCSPLQRLPARRSPTERAKRQPQYCHDRHPDGLIMRLVIQRVSDAAVSGERKRLSAKSTPALLVLAGFGHADEADLPTKPVWKKMLDKLYNLRIFPDDEDKMKPIPHRHRGRTDAHLPIYPVCGLQKGTAPVIHQRLPLPTLRNPCLNRFVGRRPRRCPRPIRHWPFRSPRCIWISPTGDRSPSFSIPMIYKQIYPRRLLAK